MALLNPFHILSNSLTSKHTMFLEVMWSDAAQVSTYLTSQHVGILQSLVNLTVLQVILWSLSFHLLVELFVVLHLIGKDIYIYIYIQKLVYSWWRPTPAEDFNESITAEIFKRRHNAFFHSV